MTRSAAETAVEEATLITGATDADVKPYGYILMPGSDAVWEDWPLRELDIHGGSIAGDAQCPAAQETHREAAEYERRLESETRRSFEAGRERGQQEGRAAERAAQLTAQRTEIEGRARQLAELAEKFALARDRFLEQAEHEVVRLALAIAARILRREAQTDPLFLLGAVRVALGQLANSTQLRLVVPAADMKLWTEAVALLPQRTLKPQIIGDPEMRLGECLLQTELGSADLAVRAQLGEIEGALFDAAGAAPSIAAAPELEQV